MNIYEIIPWREREYKVLKFDVEHFILQEYTVKIENGAYRMMPSCNCIAGKIHGKCKHMNWAMSYHVMGEKANLPINVSVTKPKELQKAKQEVIKLLAELTGIKKARRLAKRRAR